MGVIVNVLKTVFTSSGADTLTTRTDAAGRSVTRLGQASAGAGRAFSAQSKGLGGLVAAYAGAAATSFALTAAFSALSKSARSIQTVEGLKSLAASSAIDGNTILANVQKITKGQLSIVESAEQVNLALSAGFNTSQIEGLSVVALKASRALGRDLGDAYTRVVRGSAKMEAELLDELGIYTKIDPATRAYALSIGKTVTQLSEYERRQAFVNAVIAEGQRKFSSINTTIPTAAEKIESFGKRVSDLGTKIGAFLAEVLAPLADFFTNNLGAGIGGFGLLGGLILGKTLSEAKSKIKNFNKFIESSAANLNKKILTLTKGSNQRIEAAKTAVSSIGGTKGTAGGLGPELKALKDIAAQRALNTQELTKAQTVLQKRITNLKAFRAAEIAQIVQARAARAATIAGTAAHVKAQEQLTKLSNKLKTTNTLLTATTTQLNAVTAATNRSTFAFAAFASGLVLRAGKTVAAIASISLGIIGLGGILLSAISIIGIFGSAIARTIGKGDEFSAWVKGFGQALRAYFSPQIVKDTKNVFQGIAAGNFSNLEKANQQLRELDTFKFKQKKKLGVIIEVEKTKEDLVKEVSDLLSKVALDDGYSFKEAATTGTTIGTVIGSAILGAAAGSAFAGIGALPGAVIGGISAALAVGTVATLIQVGDKAIEVSADTTAKVKQIYKTELAGLATNFGPDIAQLAETAIGALQEQYGEAAKLDAVAKNFLDTQIQLVLASAQYRKNVTAISSIMVATGESADKVVEAYNMTSLADNFSTLLESKDLSIPIKLQFIDIEKIREELTREIGSLSPLVGFNEWIRDDEEAMNLLQNALEAPKPLEFLKNAKISNSVFDIFRQDLQKLDISQLKFIAYGFSKLGESISEAVVKGASLNSILQRTKNVLSTVDLGLKSGTLSYEQFSKAVGDSTSALDNAKRQSSQLSNLLAIAQRNLNEAKRINLDVGDLPAIIDALIMQRNYANGTIEILEEQLKTYKAQEDSIKRQIDLTDLLNKKKSEYKNIFDLELAFFQAAASSPAEELAITVDYLRQIVKEGANAAAAYEAYANTVNKSNLGQDLKQILLGATTETLSETVNSLNSIGEGLNFAINQASTGIDGLLPSGTTTPVAFPTNKDTKDLSDVYNKALESLKAYGEDALILATSSMTKLKGEYYKAIKDIDKELVDVANKNTIATIKFEADFEQVYRDIDLLQQEGVLSKLDLALDLNSAKNDSGSINDLAAAKEENRIRQEILKEQKVLLDMQYDNDMIALGERATLMGEENTQALAAIEADRQAAQDKLTQDKDMINTLAKIYKESLSVQAKVNATYISNFQTAGANFNNTLAQVFTDATTNLGETLRTMGASVPGATVAVNTTIPTNSTIETNFDKLSSDFATASDTYSDKIEERAAALAKAENLRYDQALQLLGAEAEKVYENYILKGELLDAEGVVEAEAAKARIKAAEEAGEAADRAKAKMLALFDSVQSAFETAFNSLNDLVVYGEGSLGEIAGTFFKSIQKTIFEETLAKPLSSAITEGIFGISRKGIENATFTGDSINVHVSNLAQGFTSAPTTGEGGDGTITGMFGNITNFFKNLFGEGGIVKNLFSRLFGEGGFLSTLLKGFGSFLGSIFKAIFSVAGGGSIHRAGGGAIPQFASGGGLRDRVPALLEPGEFVIRKPMARRIGTPALQSLNATGGMGSMGTPIINFTNEGSPKDMQASPPRFDGEKYVIDIITRDLANNGPIRQSIRKGVI